MTATNHILTGALIGGMVSNPVIAIPVALVSHFVLDVLPHFGTESAHSRFFRRVLAIDSILTVLSLIFISQIDVTGTMRMLVCGLVAALPDTAWLPYFYAELKGITKPYGWFSELAKNIQWCEREWGLWVEIPWGVVMTILLLKVA